MKLNLTTLIGFFLTMLLGWFLGFIKIPYIQISKTFWLGFIAGLVLIALVFTFLYFQQNSGVNHLFQMIFTGKQDKNVFGLKRNIAFLALLSGVILLAGYGGYSFKQGKLQKLDQLETEIGALKDQANLENQKYKISLMLELMRRLDSMKIHTKDTSILSQMTNRIVSLGSFFNVQKQWDPASRSYEKLSSLRGMLLLAFLNSNLDSATFQKIKDQLSFAFADLRNVDLRGRNLQGIDLNYANLEQANLEGAQLDYAGFRGANLVGANLNRTTLVETNLIGAKLNWTKINEAKMNYARLDSADFSNASICKSNLKYATYIQTVMRYSLLQESDMSNGFFIGTDFSYANLSKANLKNPDFRRAKLNGTILNEAIIQEDWMDLLKKESNEGVSEIFEKYHILRDSTSIRDSTIVRLESKWD